MGNIEIKDPIKNLDVSYPHVGVLSDIEWHVDNQLFPK